MSDIDITIRTIVDKAIKDLDNTKKAVEGLGKTETTTKKSTEGAGISLGSLAKFATVATAAVYSTKKIYDATVGSTIAYAKEVSDLSRLIGASAEESSKLIQVADDVEVQYGTLSSALEAAIRSGVKPTIEGISELSAQYLAIKDPVDRAAFAMKIFGKNGADMMPFLELGPEQIKALGIEAGKYGTVLDEKAIAATAKFKDQLDILENKLDGLKVKVGTALIPILTAMADVIIEAPENWKNMQAFFDKLINPAPITDRGIFGAFDTLNPKIDTSKTKTKELDDALVRVTGKKWVIEVETHYTSTGDIPTIYP